MAKHRSQMALILFIFSATILSITSYAMAQNYNEVITFTGSNAQTTDYFKITSGEWRIRWSYTPSAEYPTMAVFTLFTYPKGENLYIDYVMKMGANDTSGITYVHQGNKEYYMKIGAANLQNYNIVIEQEEQAQPTPTVPELSLAVTAVALIIGVTSASIVIQKKHERKNN